MKRFVSHPSVKWVGMLVFSLLIIWLSFQFQHRLHHFRSLGLLGIFLANFLGSATLFLPAPGIATVIAGGALYPPFLVGLFATIGAVLGDMIGFLLGSSGQHVLFNKNHPWYEKATELFKQFGGLMIFIFAFVPNPLFDGVSIIAGVLKYPVWKFSLYLFLGRLARNMILSFFGARLEPF